MSGFNLEGAYHFSLGNDFNLNWSRVEKTTTRIFGAIKSTTGSVFSSHTGTVHPDWNAVNAEIAQRINFGDARSLRLHGGLQYARIGMDETTAGVWVKNKMNISNVKTINRVYNGLGPRVGADMAYHLENGMSIYATAATALLAGKHSSNSSYQAEWASYGGSSSMIVPELEAKLGATYTYPMAYGNLALDAGWMWVNYFNASLRYSHHYGLDSIAVESDDFGLQGPFLGLKWKGNVG